MHESDAAAATPSSSQYIEGIRLFNAGEYWHAHEQWEACWLAAAQTDGLFYKGIIQAAAALVHWQRGNPRGLRRNWEKARPKLVALPPQVHGLNLRALIAGMDQFVIAGGAAAHPPRLEYRDRSVTSQ
jgi:predicted metal-dependent hydrolase